MRQSWLSNHEWRETRREFSHLAGWMQSLLGALKSTLAPSPLPQLCFMVAWISCSPPIFFFQPRSYIYLISAVWTQCHMHLNCYILVFLWFIQSFLWYFMFPVSPLKGKGSLSHLKPEPETGLPRQLESPGICHIQSYCSVFQSSEAAAKYVNNPINWALPILRHDLV